MIADDSWLNTFHCETFPKIPAPSSRIRIHGRAVRFFLNLINHQPHPLTQRHGIFTSSNDGRPISMVASLMHSVTWDHLLGTAETKSPTTGTEGNPWKIKKFLGPWKIPKIPEDQSLPRNLLHCFGFGLFQCLQSLLLQRWSKQDQAGRGRTSWRWVNHKRPTSFGQF